MNSFIKLKTNPDFRRIYGRGKSFVSPQIVTYIVKTNRNTCRIGITTGKKLGSAVERNRARRVITAAFRECVPHVQKGCDIVFVARRRILKCKSYDIAKIILENLKSAGLTGGN